MARQVYDRTPATDASQSVWSCFKSTLDAMDALYAYVRAVEDTTESRGDEQRIRDLVEACKGLLDIAVLAEHYMPGELGEAPDVVHAHIAFARKVLADTLDTTG